MAQKKTTTPQLYRWLALGAIIGPIQFVLVWFILGFISPGYTIFGTHIAPYSIISQPVSGLGLGVTAPYMNTSFMILGILLLVGVYGIFKSIPELSTASRRWCIALLVLPGIGSFIDGNFTLEAFLMHTLGFGLILFSIPGFIFAGKQLGKIPYWRSLGKWLIAAGPITLALAIGYFMTFNVTDSGNNVGIAGFTERLLIVELLFWYPVLVWKVLRRNRT